MTGSLWLDLVLVLVLVSYAANGFRQGFVVSVLSLAGFLGGAAVAMWFLPRLLDQWSGASDTSLRRALVVVAVVLVLASLGQAIGVAIGRAIRSGVRLPLATGVDAVLGMVLVLAATSVLVWFVAGAVRGASPPAVSRAIGESRVLRTIDAVVPSQTQQLFSKFRSALDREGFPRVFEGFRSEPIAPVSPPDPAVVNRTAIDAAAGSVVKITGVSSRCGQGQEGSGWVVSPERIVTNAHVVAGLSQVQVRPRGTGRPYAGRVVLFDPRRDLAVVAVPGLPSRPLTEGADVGRGDSAVVAGFPLNGPYDVRAARVRDVVQARGSDIYGKSTTVRQIYSLFTIVRPGNSGGPVLDASGRVVGVVFAKSLDDATTGYALTMAEAGPVLDRAAGASTRVDTGACVRE